MNSRAATSQRSGRFLELVKNGLSEGFWKMATVALISGVVLASLVCFLIWADWRYPFPTRRSGSLGASDKFVGVFLLGFVAILLYAAFAVGPKGVSAFGVVLILLTYVAGFGATLLVFAWLLL